MRLTREAATIFPTPLCRIHFALRQSGVGIKIRDSARESKPEVSEFSRAKNARLTFIFRWLPRERELPQTEILLWTTPKEPPRALQASECRELLDPTRASCLILAQRQPGKFM